MAHIFAIADQQDERWNRFHRQAQDNRDSWASLSRYRDAYPGVYRYWTGTALEKQQAKSFAAARALDHLQRLIDADELIDAEDLISKYKGK